MLIARAVDRSCAPATDRPRLVHPEQAPSLYDAIAREKAMKKWNRAWKIELVEQANPGWLDLFETING